MKRGPATEPLDKLGAARIRATNASHLLRLIWRERTISRAELARRTALSPSTVSAIVSDLLDTDLVRTTGTGHSRGGRRPVLLGFNDDAALIVGVDLGATHVATGLMNLGGEVRAWRTKRHPVRTSPESALALVEDEIRDAVREVGVSMDRLVGLGVSVPSPVSPGDHMLSPRILPSWEGIDLGETLRDRLRVPVWIENDANAGALAELWWGAGRDGSDLAFVKVATGIGAGLILNGDIYRGLGGFAGEIGHTALDPDGPECVCGLRGCLATYIGSEALVERARRRRAEAPESALPVDADLDAIIDAALAGDRLASDVVREAGRYLGVALANLLSLVNPPTVVVGGGLVRTCTLLLEPLHEALEKRTLWPSIARASVVPSAMGERVCAIGAATLVLQAALEDPSLFPTPAPTAKAASGP